MILMYSDLFQHIRKFTMLPNHFSNFFRNHARLIFRFEYR